MSDQNTELSPAQCSAAHLQGRAAWNEHDHRVCEDAVAGDEPAVPLEEALAPHLEAAAVRRARAAELLDRITAETSAMYASLEAQLEAGGIGDTAAAAQHERRYVLAQLVLSDLCDTLSVHHPEGSSTHQALSLAAAALGWSAWRHPELVGDLQTELAAEKERVA